MTELDAIHATLHNAGWRVARHKKHTIYYCPCGQHVITISSTPNKGWRTVNNIRTNVNRGLRACGVTT